MGYNVRRNAYLSPAERNAALGMLLPGFDGCKSAYDLCERVADRLRRFYRTRSWLNRWQNCNTSHAPIHQPARVSWLYTARFTLAGSFYRSHALIDNMILGE
jgi:hypothetical protein